MRFNGISNAKGAVSTLAVCVLLAGSIGIGDVGWIASPAFGSDDGDGSSGGKGNQGGQGQGGQGAQSGQGNQGGTGSGPGGPDPESDSKGPQAGGPADTGSSGGKPVWAQEGIPEIELGRLSVARSPDMVLDRALAEALANWVDTMSSFYNLPLTSSDPTEKTIISELSLNWDNLTIFDSPLQNLALMDDILKDGSSQLPLSNSNDTLLAVFLGVASDKTLTISPETVIAVTTILGTPVTGTEAVDLAADAEAVRIAVLAGHG